jgi:hypothetical protein
VEASLTFHGETEGRGYFYTYDRDPVYPRAADNATPKVWAS